MWLWRHRPGVGPDRRNRYAVNKVISSIRCFNIEYVQLWNRQTLERFRGADVGMPIKYFIPKSGSSWIMFLESSVFLFMPAKVQIWEIFQNFYWRKNWENLKNEQRHRKVLLNGVMKSYTFHDSLFIYKVNKELNLTRKLQYYRRLFFFVASFHSIMMLQL